MNTEFTAQVIHAKGHNNLPLDRQVVCWSQYPAEPNTWRVSTILNEDGLQFAENYYDTNVPLPMEFYWFQIPQFVALFKPTEDAGL